MKTLLLLLVVLLVVPVAGEAKRGQRVIVVRDYMGADWEGVVSETVEDFAPYRPLRYERREGSCPRKRKAYTIDVCPVAAIRNCEHCRGAAYWNKVELVATATSGYRAHLTCHELMHLLGRIPDGPQDRADSCIYGPLDDPGAFDAQVLADNAAYFWKQQAKHARKHR